MSAPELRLLANYPAREASRKLYLKWVEDGCRKAEQHLPKIYPITAMTKRQRQKALFDTI